MSPGFPGTQRLRRTIAGIVSPDRISFTVRPKTTQNTFINYGNAHVSKTRPHVLLSTITEPPLPVFFFASVAVVVIMTVVP